MEFLPLEDKIINHIMSDPQYQGRSFEWRMSKAGDCPRLMDLELVYGKAPVDYTSAMRFRRGHALHTMWQEIYQEALGDDFQNPELEMTIEVSAEVDGVKHTQVITGHNDGEIASLDATYELKNVSDATYSMVAGRGHPLPANYEQGNLYAFVRKRKNVLFHYYNCNNGQSQWFMAPMSVTAAENTLAKFAERIINKNRGVIADRPYADPSGSPCFFCSKKSVCYEGFSGEFSRMGAKQYQIVEFKELYDVVGEATRARNQRLMWEKQEEAAKNRVAQMLLTQNVNYALIGEYKIEIKLGSKGNPNTTIREIK